MLWLGYRESIMDARAERSSPEWVCISKVTSNSQWFLWNTNSQGWTRFPTAPMIDSISSTMFFPVIIIHCKWQVVGNHGQRPEITAQCGRNQDTVFCLNTFSLENVYCDNINVAAWQHEMYDYFVLLVTWFLSNNLFVLDYSRTPL